MIRQQIMRVGLAFGEAQRTVERKRRFDRAQLYHARNCKPLLRPHHGRRLDGFRLRQDRRLREQRIDARAKFWRPGAIGLHDDV